MNKHFIKYIKEKGQITLIDTTYIAEYDDFVEWYKDNNDLWDTPEDELDIPGENSREYWDFVADEREINEESDRDNLAYAKIAGRGAKDMHFLISGTLGLWWGHPGIKPEIMSGLDEVISRCVGECNDYVLTYDTKAIHINAYHHDGCNSFDIYPVKRNQLETLDKRLENEGFNPEKGYDRRFFETIDDYLF